MYIFNRTLWSFFPLLQVQCQWCQVEACQAYLCNPCMLLLQLLVRLHCLQGAHLGMVLEIWNQLKMLLNFYLLHSAVFLLAYPDLSLVRSWKCSSNVFLQYYSFVSCVFKIWKVRIEWGLSSSVKWQVWHLTFWRTWGCIYYLKLYWEHNSSWSSILMLGWYIPTSMVLIMLWTIVSNNISWWYLNSQYRASTYVVPERLMVLMLSAQSKPAFERFMFDLSQLKLTRFIQVLSC